jgi:hypothetical protein
VDSSNPQERHANNKEFHKIPKKTWIRSVYKRVEKETKLPPQSEGERNLSPPHSSPDSSMHRVSIEPTNFDFISLKKANETLKAENEKWHQQNKYLWLMLQKFKQLNKKLRIWNKKAQKQGH